MYARYTPALGYSETVLSYNVSVGTTHEFKIWNYSGSNWRVYIDGAVKISLLGLAAGSTANSADVGLEVTQSRINSTQQSVNEAVLKAFIYQPGIYSWSGRDACSDTSSDIFPKWIADNNWRHALNVVLSQSAC